MSRSNKQSGFSRLRVSPRAIVVALCALVAAGLAVPGPLVEYLDKRNPILAARLFDDSGSRVTLWSLKTYQDLQAAPDPSIVETARDSLRQNAADSGALSALALYYSLRGDKTGDRIAILAEQLTRHNKLAQVVLAQNAARDGDGERAMSHLVTAIRTTDQGRNEIFAIVSRLAANAQLRQSLAHHVEDGAPWSQDLIRFMMSDVPAGPINAARIMLAADPAKSAKLQRTLNADLFAFLIESREYDLLRQLYARTAEGEADIARTSGFTPATVDPAFGAMAWHQSPGALFGSDFNKVEERIVPSVYASQGDRGVALSRTLMLPPGSYRLTETRSVLSGAENGSAVWRLSCLGRNGATVIWTGPSKAPGYSVKDAAGPVIGPGCDIQTLDLLVEGSRGGEGFEMTIDSFALQRAG